MVIRFYKKKYFIIFLCSTNLKVNSFKSNCLQAIYKFERY